MVFAALQLSFYVRFYASLPIFRLDVVPDESTYRFLPFILIPLWLVIFAITGLYNHLVIIGGAREDSQVFTSSSIVLFLILASEFFIPGWTIARGWLLAAWVGSVGLTIAGRFVMRRLVRQLRRNGLFLSPALIVGANPEGTVLADQMSREQYSGLQIVGFVDDNPSSTAGAYQVIPVVGTLSDIDQIIARYGIEELILASSAISQAQLLDLFQKYGVSRRVNLRMSSGLYQMIATGFEVAEFANVPLIGIKRIRLTGLNWAMKLFVDYCLAVLAVAILSPFLVIIGLLVRLDSRGPVIYRRRVMGVNGCQFDAFKFRTMIDDADKFLEQQPGLMREFQLNHKLKADPRITRVGALLRKTSLDELPQLFNVLRGEMSLVGPRMISPDEMARYQQAGINLLTVKPGITGLWQVNGRSDVSYEERVKMDMYYIRNWSIFLDLHLLLRTIPAILSQQGAY
ncbi:MAG TPA: sugar transferase [Anaerolineaceae bacterium]